MATRTYRQDVRAQQTQANTDRIVSTAVGLVKKTRRTADITLDDLSRDSGVTVRTILRRFGSRDGVLEAAFGEIKKEFQGYRVPTTPGDVDAAVRTLLDQYERIGDLNIRALEQEHQLPLLHRALTEARRSHRVWLEHIFHPQLDSLSPQQRERRLTALYAATDVYLWKLLRRDLKLDRRETEEAFLRLVHGVLTPELLSESRKRG
ncbi:MAG TPA: TetR/AcrR family transcriptional regulator [Vicinamibacterales bacterium]|nr:TetR/AcrR family transcriptional regulator [Vicinamibacterales bacterium]